MLTIIFIFYLFKSKKQNIYNGQIMNIKDQSSYHHKYLFYFTIKFDRSLVINIYVNHAEISVSSKLSSFSIEIHLLSKDSRQQNIKICQID